MSKPSPEQIAALVLDLAQDFKPLVAKIESGIQTTQNHYGRYMAIISTFGKGDRNVSEVIARALVQAGANVPGVASAQSILFPR
jgi:hypothetical protein